MKNTVLNKILILNSLAAALIFFVPNLIIGQAETYMPNVKNRPVLKVPVQLPGSSKPQQLAVENVNGKYILEGDMVVEPAFQRASGVVKDQRWPNGVIPYQIESGHPFAANIQAAIRDINTQTNLRIQPRMGNASYVKIIYDPDGGCWANVGKRGSGVNIISLANGCNIKGKIIHEFLHAAGMFHEQSRTDRDQHVRILTNNIYPGKMGNFNKYNTSYNGTDIGAYDHGSVMHYPRYTTDEDFAIDVTKPILETTPPGIPIGQRDGLSQKDIAGVNAMYPSSALSGNQYDWAALNAPDAILKSDVYFGLQNITHAEMVVYKKRKYGINLSWSEDLTLRNFKFKLQNHSKTSLLNGDKVAIYVKGKGYLKYKKREYGINIVWSDTPEYQWVLYSSAGRNIMAGKPFSIYNTVHKEYVVYCKRKYGINLKWVKDCSGVTSVPPPTINRPRPRPATSVTSVKTSPKPSSPKPSLRKRTNVRDHRN